MAITTDENGNLHAGTMDEYGDYVNNRFAEMGMDYALCKANKHGWHNVHDHHEDGLPMLNCTSNNYQEIAQKWVWENVPVTRVPYPNVVTGPIMPGSSIDYSISEYTATYNYNSVTTHMDTQYGVSGTGITEDGEMSGYYDYNYSEDETQIASSASAGGSSVNISIVNTTTDEIWTPEFLCYHWSYTGYIPDPVPEIYYIFDYATYCVACKFDNGAGTVTGWEHYHNNYQIHDDLSLEDHVYVPGKLQLNVDYTNPWPFYRIIKTDLESGYPIK